MAIKSKYDVYLYRLYHWKETTGCPVVCPILPCHWRRVLIPYCRGFMPSDDISNGIGTPFFCAHTIKKAMIMKREKDISFEELKEYADGIAKKNKDQIAKLVENAGINSVPDSGLNYGLTFDEGLKDCPNIQMMRLADLYSDLLMRAWDDVLRLVLNEMSAASGMSAGDNRKDTIRRFTDTIRINDLKNI